MRTIETNQIIDNARFSRFHWMVMALCALLLIFDGYDLFIYGVVLPVLMQEWGLTPMQAGALGSYALFGMMFGALGFGTLADRIGRKKGIAICFALFSSATILNGFASSPTEFGIFRFIAGLGCGGLMPNAVALMNEYAPKRLRSTLVAVMFSGYSIGGMLSAGVGIYMLPRFGWELMFFAAAVPLLLLPVILYYLPESVGFLVRQGRQAEARELLKRVDPTAGLPADAALEVADVKGASVSVLALFKEGRTVRTLSIWVAFFCCKLLCLLTNNVSREGLESCPTFGRLVDYIEEHIKQDITVEQLAELAHMSPRSLYVLFERKAGTTPKSFIRQRKLERVRCSLSGPEGGVRNVTEVAMDYGFLHLGRFSESYRNAFGELPSDTLRRAH